MKATAIICFRKICELQKFVKFYHECLLLSDKICKIIIYFAHLGIHFHESVSIITNECDHSLTSDWNTSQLGEIVSIHFTPN